MSRRLDSEPGASNIIGSIMTGSNDANPTKIKPKDGAIHPIFVAPIPFPIHTPLFQERHTSAESHELGI
jgi:hypothetical protein